MRSERARKDERAINTTHALVHIGGAVALNGVDAALSAGYGDDPRSGLLFMRFGIH
jgi:hypothetical protein